MSEYEALLNQHGDKKIDRTYVARRPLAGARGYGLDIFMHSGVIIRTNDGMKILLERTEKPHEFKCTPIQVPDEHQTFMIDETVWKKQVVGQSVMPDITVRDVITLFGAHVKTHKYSPGSWNCHRAQEAIRKSIELNFPKQRFLTRVSSTAATYVPWGSLESSTNRRRSSLDSLDLAVRSVPAGLELDWDLPETSSSKYDLQNALMPRKLQRQPLFPHLDLASETLFSQDSHASSATEGSLGHLFNPVGLEGQFKNPLPYYPRPDKPQDFPGPSWEFPEFPANAGNIPEATAKSQRRQGERIRGQARFHLPGLLGGLQNIKNCFEKGEYFLGLWNTGMLAGSASMLYATGGVATLIVQADPETQEPYFRVSMAGLS